MIMILREDHSNAFFNSFADYFVDFLPHERIDRIVSSNSHRPIDNVGPKS